MEWIFRLIGYIFGFKYVRCRVCGKLTEPSIAVGNICSIDCYNEEKQEKLTT